MNISSQNKSTAARRFWDAFKACAEENRVRPDRSGFYVRWAQAFVDFLPEKRLRERSREDIESFLAQLAERPGIKHWQLRQAEHALRILYETFLPGYAPENAAKKTVKSQTGKPPEGFRPGPGTFRDRVVPGEVERLFSPFDHCREVRNPQPPLLYPHGEGLRGLGPAIHRLSELCRSVPGVRLRLLSLSGGRVTLPRPGQEHGGRCSPHAQAGFHPAARAWISPN